MLGTYKEFKIIKIIDSYNVLINGGSKNGLRENSNLEVYSEGEEIIVDDINYGTLDNIKATLEIKTLYPKMALCQSNKIIKKIRYSAIEEELNSLRSSFNSSLRNSVKGYFPADKLTPETVEEVAALKVSNPEKNDLSYLEDKILVVGDLVRKKE